MSPDELAAGPAHVLDDSYERRTRGRGRTGAAEVIAGSCDRCPAAAVAQARLPSGSALMLCGHHGRRYAPALLAQGAVVTGTLAFAARTEQPLAGAL